MTGLLVSWTEPCGTRSVPAQEPPQDLDDRPLAQMQLYRRRLEVEPGGAIDLRHRELAARAGRPIDLDQVRLEPGRVEITRESERHDRFAAGLPECTQRLQIACRK